MKGKSMSKAKKGLGRGMDAVIVATSPAARADDEQVVDKAILEVDINKIEPNRNQPRRDFDAVELAELADSVRLFGVLSPLLVKKEGEYYIIIAGERRWRAARMAGLRALPVVLREFDDKETLEVALIENLQRSDLNPVEEALSFRRLADEFGMTQEEIAERIGKSRSAVANVMRLLNLSDFILDMLRRGALSAGHAKVLLGVADERVRDELADSAGDGGMSVRELEEAVANLEKSVPPPKKAPPKATASYAGLEKELSAALMAKTRVKANKAGDKGTIEIAFASSDELDRLYLALRKME